MRKSRRFGLIAAFAVSTVALPVVLVAGGGEAEADVTEQLLFSKGEEGYECIRIPALVRAANDDVLAFAEARHSADCDDVGDIDLVVKRSTDDGETWGDMEVVNSGSSDNWANPVPILEQETGRIVLLSVHNPADTARPRTPHVQHSEDHGATWSEPESIESDLDELDWGHFASGPGGGIQLERGDNAGRLVAGVNFSNPEDNAHGAGLIYSDDAGDNWQLGALDFIDDDVIRPQELSLFERTDGAVHADARENVNENPSDPVRVYAVSDDGGDSFSEDFAAYDDLPGTVKVQGSVLRLRASDTGDRYDRVLSAAPTDGELRKNMTIRSSFNDGRTWESISDGVEITSDRAAYSDMELLASGEIGLLYEGGSYPDGEAQDEIRFARFTEEDLGMPDDYSGTSTPDESGVGNDAILRDGASLSDDGRFGSAVSLGGNDHVHLPFAESLAVGAGDFTFATWVNYGASAGPQTILWAYGQGDDRSQLWLRAEPEDDRIRATVQSQENAAVVASPNAYDDGEWRHVVLKREGETISLYVDGEQVDGNGDASPDSISPARPFRMYLGQRLDGEHRFDGMFDETRLYKRGLSDEEIDSLYEDNADVDGDLVLHLPFEESD